MLKLIACIIIFAANCCAHQFLTCSISDSVLSQQSPQTSPNPLLGSSGAQGPKGEMGSRGSPGQKGEPGIQDDRQINLLRNQFNSLSQEVAALKKHQEEQINILSQVSKSTKKPNQRKSATKANKLSFSGSGSVKKPKQEIPTTRANKFLFSGSENSKKPKQRKYQHNKCKKRVAHII